MNHNTTVFVVDDDASVRRSLRRLLESINLSVETFETAESFLAACDASRPGCLVLDVRMPGLSGLELQEKLAARRVEIPIIFITGFGDVPMTARAMKAGAVDFIQKPFNEQELLDAVNRALDRDARQRNAAAERDVILSRVATLTPRERDVFIRVSAGKINKEIAAEFGICEKTIKVHRARVMEKMRADSLAELVLFAQLAGFTNKGHPVPVAGL